MSALDVQVGGDHYRNGGIQPVQFIEANKLQYLEASVVKRVTRHNQKGGKGRQDIEKAIHELQLLLELRYSVDTQNTVLGALEKISEQQAKLRTPSIQVPPHKLMAACIVCGKSDGHGGLQCPNTIAYTNDPTVG